MANYKDIHGINIETVTSNPDNPANGQVWYNSTDQKLRANAQTTAGAWSTGGSVNAARQLPFGAGSQTAGLMAGGNPGSTASNELYNGTSWTEVANLNTGRHAGAASGITNTAVLAFGGYSTAYVSIAEEWNGSSWTEVGDLNLARWEVYGQGSSNTAALCTGGQSPGGTYANNENWNGSSWTEVADVNTAKTKGAAAGQSNTSVLVFGGNPSPSQSAKTEEWNGTGWTEIADLSTGRRELGGAGIVTAALAFSGEAPPNTTATEEFAGAGANDTKEFDLS